MAGKRLRDNGTWEYVFKRKGVLAVPVYLTFDSEVEGDAYAERVEPLLARGVVPLEMVGSGGRTLGALIDLYSEAVTSSESESVLLPIVRKAVGEVKIERLSYGWVEGWVDAMKAEGKASSSISKRVCTLARVVDWAMRRDLVTLPSNPVRMLPRGYSSAKEDNQKLYGGERDRVLSETEEGAIRKVLVKKEEHLLFDMALETAMRLSEMFTLSWAQVDLERKTIFLERTKNTRAGRSGRRQVPISTVLYALLKECDRSADWVFPMWWEGGGKKERDSTQCMLSHAFARRFKRAGVEDFRFHDLRHTATTRLYERTSMTDLEIASITGHKGFRMLQRYANIRGSTLASKMW